MQEFHCATRIISGPDALRALENIRAQKALIVTDRFFLDNGTAKALADRLPDCECEVFADVLPDPEVGLVAEGCAKGQNADVILALGGGSVLDCAKAMSFFALKRPMLIAIPTTSGTGSEVTSFSILTHDGVKHPLVDDRLRPDWAILDESLLGSLPKSLIADTGMDLISHALEAIAAKNATPFTDALAFAALRTGLHLLPASYEGELAARGELHAAATMAGLSFDRAGLGMLHALSHALGGRFHVAHGRLNGVLLPAVMEFNAPASLHRYGEAARACGMECASDRMAFRSLSHQLKQLRRSLNLPGDLAQAGIPMNALAQSMDALVQAALNDPCMATNPITPTRDQLIALLEGIAQ